MFKRVFWIGLAAALSLACLNTARGGLSGSSDSAVVVEDSLRTVQVQVDGALPPYGLRVRAETAAVDIAISSSQKEDAARLADLQAAVAHIAAQAEGDEAVSLAAAQTRQANGYSDRALLESSIVTNYSAAVTLRLTTPLPAADLSLLDSLATFQQFLNSLTLPESIKVEVAAIQAEMRDPEQYRPQLIQQVYRELAAVQSEYGPDVTFSITVLHEGVKTMPLNDVEYYLYVAPVIVVNEF